MSDEIKGYPTPPRLFNFPEWRLVMAVLVVTRHFPERRKKVQATLFEYLAVVDEALCECDAEQMGTATFYADAEEKIRKHAEQYWFEQFKEFRKAAKE